MLKEYLQVIFQPDLLFNLFCVLVCFVAAVHYGYANVKFAELAVIGAVLIQMAINLVDDYIDSKTTDKNTIKTKFSGGSELIVSGAVNGRFILLIGLLAGLVAAILALYLTYTNPIILPFVIFAIFALALYDKFLSRILFLAEPLLMICFALLNFGAFIIIHSSIHNLGDVGFVFIPLGMLVGVFSLITTMPDKKIYKASGRRDGAVVLSSGKKVAEYYLFYEIVIYAMVLTGILIGALPLTFLLLFITVPAISLVYKGIRNYRKPKLYEKYMGINLYNTLAFFILVIIAYII